MEQNKTQCVYNIYIYIYFTRICITLEHDYCNNALPTIVMYAKRTLENTHRNYCVFCFFVILLL